MKKNIAIILIIVVTILVVFLQRNIYQNRFVLQEDRTVELEDEIIKLSSLNEELYSDKESSDEDYEKLERDKQELIEQIEKSGDENHELVSYNKKLEDKLLDMKYDLIKDNLSDYWYKTWDDIYKSEGVLTDEEIEEINYLLQPVFSNNDWFEVNPLSCFFTSYYEDVRDINLAKFLRYFPNGEVPEELPEFEALKNHENWPFGDADSIDSLPAPIHRYKSEVVQDIFTAYADINLDGLTGVDGLIYLDSTDAYYNFTSDLGPGIFICTEGIVEDGVIKLYGNSRNESVLTIVKVDGKYVIKSLYAK